jgi:hypothetical protein
MSENFSGSILRADGGEEAERRSRSSSGSPGANERSTNSVEILEHSMESLVVSDSSEEGILMGEIPGGTEGVVAEQLEGGGSFSGDDSNEVIIAANEAEVANSDRKAELQDGEGSKVKRKKRRISSRRTRTVKLSESDRVICEIAGVQVTLVTS